VQCQLAPSPPRVAVTHCATHPPTQPPDPGDPPPAPTSANSPPPYLCVPVTLCAPILLPDLADTPSPVVCRSPLSQAVSSEFRGGAASRLLRGSLVASLPGLTFQHTSAETMGDTKGSDGATIAAAPGGAIGSRAVTPEQREMLSGQNSVGESCLLGGAGAGRGGGHCCCCCCCAWGCCQF
jgi:hypothetical protein